MSVNYERKEENFAGKQDIVAQYVNCRKAQKLSQQDISEKSGVARPNIARFEGGKTNPTIDMLYRLADALDMDIEFTLKKRKKKKS